jgi:hypothetical protein
MKIENITWIGLSAWWSSQKKGHLSISDGLFREIVIDNQSVHSVISEVLTNSASRIWSQKLEWCGIRSGSSDDTGVRHGTGISKDLDEVSDSGSLLTDSDVNAVKLFEFIVSIEGTFLVKNSINSNSSLSSLSTLFSMPSSIVELGMIFNWKFNSLNFVSSR